MQDASGRRTGHMPVRGFLGIDHPQSPVAVCRSRRESPGSRRESPHTRWSRALSGCPISLEAPSVARRDISGSRYSQKAPAKGGIFCFSGATANYDFEPRVNAWVNTALGDRRGRQPSRATPRFSVVDSHAKRGSVRCRAAAFRVQISVLRRGGLSAFSAREVDVQQSRMRPRVTPEVAGSSPVARRARC